MPLKFCANLSFMFQETKCLLERYDLAKRAGFRAVECAFPYDYSVEDVKTTKEKAGVEQILINVFVGDVTKGELGFAAVPGKEAEFKKSLNLAVAYAKALNCSRIHIMSGRVENITRECDQAYENNMRYAADLLSKENIVGLIEPINPYSVPKYFMNSYDKGLELVKKINSPNLKLMMDLFHLQHLRGNLTNNITDLLPYVGHIQIAQVPHRNEPNTPGEVNYPYLFSVLEKLGYDGWIGLEYKPASDTVTGLKWVEEYGYKL
ncbi:putative hydroxypyruvate isomerase [Anabrus simplex]|uniref:putative hydroxypyruvate isomerase n=1 Tax=Anabrus simplex TaxID=316456 RepID=UPI0034DD90ED